MTKVVIAPGLPVETGGSYRAAARGRESVGITPGAALDALAEQLDVADRSSFVVVQSLQPDAFFTVDQQRRLSELLKARRDAAGQNKPLSSVEQAELEKLIDLELEGATRRSQAMLNELRS